MKLISISHQIVLTAVICVGVLLGGSIARGQGIITGSISGTVVDSTGAVIPAASITVTDLAKGTSFTTKAQSDGNFAFQALPIGTYSLTITSSGFATTQIPAVGVVTGVDHSVGKQVLGVGTSTTVTVESQAGAQIETVQSQVTTTFDTQQITNLPTAGGFDELALLIPGVVDVHADNFSNTNGVGISVNGERGRANNFEIDGQSNNDNSIGGPQVFFGNDEALAQIQIVTDNFGAQYGRNAGSVVNYITKSGTNSIHGSAIYKYSGNFTSSLDTGVSKGPQFGFCAPGQNPNTGCTPPVVPRFVSNWWGGTLGVPIIKDKLWAFGSTYWNRETEFGALNASPSSLFPTQAGLTSIAQAFPSNPGVAVLQQLSPYAVTTGNPRQLLTSASSCPASLGTFNPANGTCTETVASGGTSVQIPFSNFGRQVPFLASDQEDLGRIDWQATPRDRFYVRYFYQNNPTSPDGATANGGFVNVEGATHSVGADLTHTFSPRWVNQLRYSFQQSTIAFEGGGFTNCLITAFATCPSNIAFSNPNFSNLGLPSNLPQGRVVKVSQVQDNATWTFRQHAITFGGEFDNQNSPNVFLPNASATFTYDNLNDFITGGCPQGACSASLAIGNPTIPFKEQDVALYFQDDWKVTSSLTLNLGLRWEFFQQAINLLHRESVANQTGPSPLWNTALPLSVTTLPAIPNYYKNIEPRLGFVWNPDFNKKLVIRGGYAINVEPAFYNINLNVAANAPLVSSGSINCTGGTVQCIPTGGATFATVQAQTDKLLPLGGSPGDLTQSLVSPNFHNPQGQTYTLGVQYQILNSAVVDVRYVGNHTSSQFQDVNANPFLGDVAAAFPNVVSPSSLCTVANSTLPDGADIGRLNCGSSVVNQITNTAFSQYNSIQANLTTRNYHGVTATFAFTHSKNIDNTSEIFGNAGLANSGGNTIAVAQNPLDIDRGERAVSGIDLPNTASISFTYSLPAFHTGKDLLNKLTNGWQANTIWVYNSGQPYTDYQGVNTSSPQANPDDNRTLQSYNDTQFNNNQVGFDVQRPILSNKNAPLNTLGIYTDTDLPGSTTTFTAPQLVDYVTGTPVTPSQVHFIANNQLAANVLGNPYPGTGRNTLRGNTYNNADFSVFKNTKITERLTFRLEVDAFNVLNRSYYGTPGADLGDANFGSLNNFLNTPAQGSAVAGFGTGVRNMIFSGKILF